MSDTKMLTREEIVSIRGCMCSTVSQMKIDEVCNTALHYMAEVEGLERDNADLSEYADKKEAEVKRLMAEVERLRPVVEAAREDFKARVWQMICDLPNDIEFDDTKMAAVSMSEMRSILDRAFEALEAASFQSLCSEIGQWHRSIFGEYDPAYHVQVIAEKAIEEATELYNAETRIQMRLEIADLLICALAAADRLGVDPEEIAREKLNILISRGMYQLQRDKDRGITQASERAIAVKALEEAEGK